MIVNRITILKAFHPKLPRNERIKLFVVIVPSTVTGIIVAEFLAYVNHLKTPNNNLDTFIIAFLLGCFFALGTSAYIYCYLLHCLRAYVLDYIKLKQNNNSIEVSNAGSYQPVPSVAERSLNRMRFKLKKTTKEQIMIGILVVAAGIFTPVLQNHGYLSMRYSIILKGISGFIAGIVFSSFVLIPFFTIVFKAI